MLVVLLITSTVVSSLASDSTAKPFVPQVSGLTSQICLERPENSGAMNSHPNWVYIYERGSSLPDRTVILSGGQSVCVFLFPGRYTVVASSNRFDGPASDAPNLPNRKECQSPPHAVDLRASERVTLNVWPGKAKTGSYSECGWVVLPRTNNSKPNYSFQRTPVHRSRSYKLCGVGAAKFRR